MLSLEEQCRKTAAEQTLLARIGRVRKRDPRQSLISLAHAREKRAATKISKWWRKVQSNVSDKEANLMLSALRTGKLIREELNRLREEFHHRSSITESKEPPRSLGNHFFSARVKLPTPLDSPASLELFLRLLGLHSGAIRMSHLSQDRTELTFAVPSEAFQQRPGVPWEDRVFSLPCTYMIDLKFPLTLSELGDARVAEQVAVWVVGSGGSVVDKKLDEERKQTDQVARLGVEQEVGSPLDAPASLAAPLNEPVRLATFASVVEAASGPVSPTARRFISRVKDSVTSTRSVAASVEETMDAFEALPFGPRRQKRN